MKKLFSGILIVTFIFTMPATIFSEKRRQKS